MLEVVSTSKRVKELNIDMKTYQIEYSRYENFLSPISQLKNLMILKLNLHNTEDGEALAQNLLSPIASLSGLTSLDINLTSFKIDFSEFKYIT